jgi:hypothetical protein
MALPIAIAAHPKVRLPPVAAHPVPREPPRESDSAKSCCGKRYIHSERCQEMLLASDPTMAA